MATDITVFLICAGLLMVAGTRLASDGDVVADKTGIGGLWIGAVVIALATSLPELVSDITAGWKGYVDLAVGDILGSGMSNMLILAIVDILFVALYSKRRGLLKNVSGGHIGAASLAIALTAITAIFMLLPKTFGISTVGGGTFVIAAVYLAGIWLLFRQESSAPDIIPVTTDRSLPYALVGLGVSAAVIFATAPFMVNAAQRIAVASGLGATFFGTLFLAMVTSFPELVVSITAVRMGAFDLAVGNLFGSNAFNIFVLVFVDLAYKKGSLLASVGKANLVTALFLMLMMGVGLASVAARGKKRSALLIPDSIALVVLYAIGMYAVYSLS
jgi:cation:H+ antiporter